MSWLITYIPYLQNNKFSEHLFLNLDDNTKKIFSDLLVKISLLTQYEILSDDLLFTEYDKKLSKDFAYYMLQNWDDKFAMNMFYWICLQKKYNFNADKKDILDFWACDWDTSIAFKRLYTTSKVYAFEPEKTNFGLLKKNIADLWYKKDIIPVLMWVWKKNEILKIQWNGAGANITNKVGDEIEITTIDKFVQDNNVNPWLMKRDIEGMEYDSIVGAEQTIKKFKPILLISIYHTGKDFFEIKPLIESWGLWYKFGIERQHSSHPFADTLLICY